MKKPILNLNDYVWVRTGRDRERGGIITDVDHSSHPEAILYKVKFYGADKQFYYTDEDVRSMTKNENPKTATDPNVIRIPGKGGTKHDSDKNRLELIPVSGIEGIGRAMTFGAKKYAAHNWAQGFGWMRLCGSALRHLMAWMSGQDKDPESGLSHLDHLGACVVMLIAHETEGLGVDDRRKTDEGIPASGGVGGVQ